MRLVIVRITDRDGKTTELWLITDRLDLDAELVALAYRYRWTVELFFRWLKCVLGARHLVATNRNGVMLQMYAALIVSLLIVLRTGRKPTKRTFEMIQFYLLGWVSDAEFNAHLARLKAAKKSPPSDAPDRAASPRRRGVRGCAVPDPRAGPPRLMTDLTVPPNTPQPEHRPTPDLPHDQSNLGPNSIGVAPGGGVPRRRSWPPG